MNIPKIEYIVFYPFIDIGLIKLNMTICKNIKIDLSIPVKINENINKHNISSIYYNSICSTTTSEKGTDITLDDRKNEFIEKNMTLCEEDCDLVFYNYTNQKVDCSCLVKIKLAFFNEIKINKTKLLERFADIKNIMNFGILKCWDIVLNGKSIKLNAGFFIFIIILLIKFVSLFVFYLKDYFSLEKQILEIEKAKNQEFNLKNKKIKGRTTIDNTNFEDINQNNKIVLNQRKKNVKKQINKFFLQKEVQIIILSL